MSSATAERGRWLGVAVFAAAMAWVEAAVVYYLRTMTDRIQPYQLHPLPLATELGHVELVREAATLIMLVAVGALAGRTWLKRIGYGAIAFGIWDVLYYVFLKAICNWPGSLLDWDVLFLLPLPWWGPVLAPVCIAILMMAWGTLVTQFTITVEESFAVRPWLLNGLGTALALYVFMADSIRMAGGGMDALRNVLPIRFNWPLFGVSLVFMAAPLAESARRVWRRRLQDNPVLHCG
jgi:hypothetical protein